MPRPFVKAVALSGAVAASALFALSANAAQVLTPKRGAAVIDNVTLPAGTSLAAGSTLFIDVDYNVTGNQSVNEAGLGLKIGYDATKFDQVILYDVNGVQTSTSVSNLQTKCMIAKPSDQLVSGNMREVVFGWIDTSIRAAGAVGWPGTADPAAPGTPNGCLNPGSIVTESGALTVPTTLFRIGLKSKGAFTSGSTNVTLNTAGNISYANAGNVDTAKTIVVNGAAAPACSLDVDGNGSVTAFRDGILIIRHMLGLTSTALTSGMTPVPDATTVTNNVTAIMSLIDVNGNLPSAGTTPFVDGILLIRMMLGLNGTALTSGITLNATNSTRFAPNDLITYVNQTCNQNYALTP